MLLIFFLVFAACNEETVDEPEKKSDLKEMTEVVISAGDLNFIVAKQSDEKTFKFTVPLGFDLQLLSKTKVVFTLSEGAYSDRMSGSELNFSSVESIDITVTAEDKTTKVYTIEKEVELYSDAKILTFKLTVGTEEFEGAINDADGKVTLTVPYLLKEELATATPVFFISPSATVDFPSGEARDFSKPVFYEVTSQDLTKRTWEVIVTVGPASAENDIIEFKFKIGNEELDGVINKTNHTVSIFVSDDFYDVYKTGIPTIEVSEYATITPASGETLAFKGESPYTFVYSVTAQDGVSRQWLLVITVEDGCVANPHPGCPNYEESTPVLASTMTIGLTAYTVDETKIEKIDDGIWYMSTTITNPSKPLVVHTVRFETSARGYSLETWIGRDSVSGKEAPSTMRTRYAQAGREVIAAINGGFYGTEVGGLPLGAQVMNGLLAYPTVYPPNISVEQPIIGFDRQNRPYMGNLNMNAFVRKGNNTTFDISIINSTRWGNYLVLYNSFRGNRTGTNEWGTELLCEPVNGPWETLSTHVNVRCKVIGKGEMEKSRNMAIPKGSIVLSGNGTANAYLSTIEVGDFVNVTVDYSLKSNPNITSTTMRKIVSGYNIVLQDNKVVDPDWNLYPGTDHSLLTASHPRTSAGFSTDGKYVYFTVVEGRNPTSASPTISAGVSTMELGQVMQYFGAANAINLDGGGSSCIMVGNQTKNFLSDGSQRQVADGLAIIKR